MRPIRFISTVTCAIVLACLPLAQAGKGTPPLPIETVFTGWHPFAQLDAQLDVLNAKMKPFKGMSKLSVIGKSGEGHRKLRILSLGKPPAKKKKKKNAAVEERHEFMLMGTMHGREWISAYAVLYLAWQLVDGYVSGDEKIKQLLDHNQVHLFPFLNPDGYEFTRGSKTQTARLWRKNRRALCSAENCAHGIDLNRNWGVKKKTWGFGATRATSDVYQGKRPFSEPELKAIASWLRSHAKNLDVFFDVHCCSGEILPPVYYHDEPEDLIAENLAMCGRIARSMNMAMDNSTLGRRRKFRYKFREREKEFSETNTGIGVDWIYGEAKVKKVFIIETRGNDTKILDYIFDMDPKLILPVSREVQAGFWQAVRETLPAEEGSTGDDEKQPNALPEASDNGATSEPADGTDDQDPVENPVQLDAILEEMSSDESTEDDADGSEEVGSKGVGDVPSSVEAAKLAGEALGKDSSFVSDFDSMVENSDVEDGANATMGLPNLGDALEESDGSVSVNVFDVDLDGDEDEDEDEESADGKVDAPEAMDDGMDQLDGETDGDDLQENTEEEKDDASELEEVETEADALSLDDQLMLAEESEEEATTESESSSQADLEADVVKEEMETEAESDLDLDSDAPSTEGSVSDDAVTDTDTDEGDRSSSDGGEESSSLEKAESSEAADTASTESDDEDAHPLDPPSEEVDEGDSSASATHDMDDLSDDESSSNALDLEVDDESKSEGHGGDNPFEGLDEALEQSEKDDSKADDSERSERDVELSLTEDDDEGDRDERLKRKMKQWKAHQSLFKSQAEEMDKLLGPDEERPTAERPYAYSVRLGSSKNEIPLWEFAAGGSFLLMLTVALRHRYLHSKQQHID